jgi:predicted ATPase
MVSRYLKNINAIGIHGRYNFVQDFHKGVNILYGLNGTGKTTFLHIISNLLNGDLERFAFLKFETIEAEISDQTKISISRTLIDEVEYIVTEVNGSRVIEPFAIKAVMEKDFSFDIRDFERRPTSKMVQFLEEREQSSRKIDFLPSAAYFPAFRTMIEAWASTGGRVYGFGGRGYEKLQQARNTLFARQLFGKFVPQINYPSPVEIEQGLIEEMNDAISLIRLAESQYLGEIVPNIFKAISDSSMEPQEDVKELLSEIDHLSAELKEHPLGIESSLIDLSDLIQSLPIGQKDSSDTVPRILNIYREALKKVVDSRRQAFEAIEIYLDSVNSFLINSGLTSKKISIKSRDPALFRAVIQIDFGDDKPSLSGIKRALSSGERQIITLIYAATHMSKQDIVLIDEPEISLHVDWQQPLLKKMAEQLKGRQIIACTHSPVIGVDYEDQISEFTPQEFVGISGTSDTFEQEFGVEIHSDYDEIPF